MRKISGITFHLYHYAGNNPVKYIDPDGKFVNSVDKSLIQQSSESHLGYKNSAETTIKAAGCVLTAYTRIASKLCGHAISLEKANKIAEDNKLFTNIDELSPQAGAQLINLLLDNEGINDISVDYRGAFLSDSLADYAGATQLFDMSNNEYFLTGRITTTNNDGTKTYNHTLNINGSAAFMDGSEINIMVNDTSGVRKKINNDVRSNKIDRIDCFIVKRTYNDI